MAAGWRPIASALNDPELGSAARKRAAVVAAVGEIDLRRRRRRRRKPVPSDPPARDETNFSSVSMMRGANTLAKAVLGAPWPPTRLHQHGHQLASSRSASISFPLPTRKTVAHTARFKFAIPSLVLAELNAALVSRAELTFASREFAFRSDDNQIWLARALPGGSNLAAPCLVLAYFWPVPGVPQPFSQT